MSSPGALRESRCHDSVTGAGIRRPQRESRLLASAPIIKHRVYAIRQFKHKGRGLVATQEIAAGVPIVSCPVVVYDDEDAGRISKTKLGDYNFRFGARRNRQSMVLGVLPLGITANVPNPQ